MTFDPKRYGADYDPDWRNAIAYIVTIYMYVNYHEGCCFRYWDIYPSVCTTVVIGLGKEF